MINLLTELLYHTYYGIRLAVAENSYSLFKET